jgi:hypothetical protein
MTPFGSRKSQEQLAHGKAPFMRLAGGPGPAAKAVVKLGTVSRTICTTAGLL